MPCLGKSPNVPCCIRFLHPVFTLLCCGLYVLADISETASVNVELLVAGAPHHGDWQWSGTMATLTLLRAARDAWQADARATAVVLFLLNGLWPFIQTGVLLIVWFLPGSCLTPSSRGSFLRLFAALGKCGLSFPWLISIWAALCQLRWRGRQVSADFSMSLDRGLFLFLGAAILTNVLGYAADHYHYLSTRSLSTSPWARSGRCVGRYSASSPLKAYSEWRHWPTILCPLVAVATAGSAYITAFSVSLTGSTSHVLTAAHAKARLEYIRSYSLLSFGLQEPEKQGPEEEEEEEEEEEKEEEFPDVSAAEVGSRLLQVTFLVTSLMAPMLLAGVLWAVWILPLQPHTQNGLLKLGYALDAWVALDVFVAVVAVAALDFGKMTTYFTHEGAMLEACTWMERELSRQACVGANVKLEKGFVLLAASAIALLIVPKVVLRACSKAAQQRDELSGRARASSALAVNDAKPGLPLEGVTMVFTGEMDAITRQDAEEKAKAAGAKVMSGVSGNVQYLVAGSRLDDGRPVEETSKYRKMMELKEKGKKHPELLTEAQFLALLPDACAARATLPTFEEATVQVPKTGPVCQNWVDHFAPKSLDQLVGNASIVRKLTEWLRDWDDVVLKGRTKKAPFKPGGGMPENINARAALISGPPGIGKTTTCRLVAKLHAGYEVLEFNASDARGQKIIQDMASGIADNRTLSFGDVGAKKVPALTKKAIIIMDEVDGMGAGDRGGMAALGRMIKKTRNPIMCICNDSHSPKVRSLAFSCYDLKFSRPTKNTVAQRCAQISASTGLQVETNALEALAESCGSDMRMLVESSLALCLLGSSCTF
ncbi:Replication factor C subunit 1 [Symbiodinium microadriaticum]|uniref:Replication factor C subunit 1 n=1 Tax=Symbiodinium microadriaticum TaxID=2951 RepID=A0A1Q9D048_SYMMI|nr:Replication factor C subunit 1 [Symbiodinium microadriaticum]